MSRPKESFLPPLWVLTSVTVVGLIWLAAQLRELVVLLVIGYFIAYAIDPILSRLEAKGLARGLGFTLVCAVVVGLLVLIGVTAVPTIIDEFHKLTANLSQYIQVGRERLGPYWDKIIAALPLPTDEEQDLADTVARLPHMLSEVNGDAVKKVFATIGTTLLQGYNKALALVNIALLPFIVYYLAMDLPKIHSCVVGLVPLTRRTKFVAVFREIDTYVSAFVRGQAIVCTILFVLYAIGLGLVGVDLWLLLAAISGFGNIIPYVGFLAGIILSSLMALVTFGDLVHLLWVWAVYAIVQALEGTFITPRIMGESVGLSPLVIILALFAGGQLFGLLGIFLAVPAAATLRVLARSSYQWVIAR
jgi:predicted PurR-regulated permease PerM